MLRAPARDVIAARDAESGLDELKQVLNVTANAEPTATIHHVDQQRAFTTLASMKHKEADALLAVWADRLATGGVSVELQVDLLEAATARREVASINQALQRRETALNANTATDPLAALRLTLQGGDADFGRAIFLGHAQSQCIRCHKLRGERSAQRDRRTNATQIHDAPIRQSAHPPRTTRPD